MLSPSDAAGGFDEACRSGGGTQPAILHRKDPSDKSIITIKGWVARLLVILYTHTGHKGLGVEVTREAKREGCNFR